MSDLPHEHRRRLQAVAAEAQADFSGRHEAREQAYRLSRDVIRNSANSIRATHRSEFARARELLETTRRLVGDIERALQGHPSVYYAGFVEDGQKEYAEASAMLAFAQGAPLPNPQELRVGYAPYLNGLAEAVGELRRFILDSLRRDDFSRCEELMEVMDEVYSILVSMDFPEGVTKGLRRSTDMARGVLERTRGDLTLALRQHRLERTLSDLEEARRDQHDRPGS